MDDLDLTKKAEAYVAASLAADPETLLVPLTNRKAIADSIERLIDMLDAMSPDPDLEDTADDEPWLGWGNGGPRFYSTLNDDGRGSPHDDREADDSDLEESGDEHDASATANWSKGGHWCEDVEEENEHGGDIQDEPHDDQGEAEPYLGWGNATGQTGVGVEGWTATDNEQAGWNGGLGFTGEGHDQGREMLRSLGRRRTGRDPDQLTIIAPGIARIGRW